METNLLKPWSWFRPFRDYFLHMVYNPIEIVTILKYKGDKNCNEKTIDHTI